MKNKTIERYAYKNTSSSAGSPEKFIIPIEDIVRVNVWVNNFGNPSYGYIMKNRDTYLMIDEYGGMNDLPHSVHRVNRKKDLV